MFTLVREKDFFFWNSKARNDISTKRLFLNTWLVWRTVFTLIRNWRHIRRTNNLADIWQPAGFEINTQTAQTDTRRAFLGSVMKSLCGESRRAAVWSCPAPAAVHAAFIVSDIADPGGPMGWGGGGGKWDTGVKQRCYFACKKARTKLVMQRFDSQAKKRPLMCSVINIDVRKGFKESISCLLPQVFKEGSYERGRNATAALQSCLIPSRASRIPASHGSWKHLQPIPLDWEETRGALWSTWPTRPCHVA